jgi:thiosulfate reductase cytochrome b subunit
VHFIALHVISEVTAFYFEALASNEKILENLEKYYPEKEIRGRDVLFSQRSCFHKIARLIYRTFRMIYTSVIFYFVPFLPIMI